MIVVFDTETTGLHAGHHEVIQIAAQALDPATLSAVAEFASYLRPLHPERASQTALDIHGLSLDFLAQQPDPATVRRQFAGWVAQHGGRPQVVGYNVQFDLGFTKDWPVRWTMPPVDVMQPVLQFLTRPGLIPNATLVTAAQYLGIPINAHDALGDVRATAEIYRRFQLAWKPVISHLQPV